MKVKGSTSNGYYNEYDAFYIKHPFSIVFRFAGTVWPMVLPYCVLNCVLLASLATVKTYTDISISIMPQGHALMSLLIAYLGVSKVNLAYERYMSAQIAVGHAFMTLRELHQLALTLTENYFSKEAEEWRVDTRRTLNQLIHETVATLRDGRHAALLARNVLAGSTPQLAKGEGGSDDPMTLVHVLRSHLYHDSLALCKQADEQGMTELQLLERCKMLDLLHEFTISYRNLLRLASTPMPFALVQMGRTFTFVWTLTIPFVLVGKDFIQDAPSAFSFVILLTYGFLGLEFVSRMLSNPFGDEIRNDLNIKGMGAAAINGIEHDSNVFDAQKRTSDGKSSPRNAGSLRQLVEVRQTSLRKSARNIYLGASEDPIDDNATIYCAMSDDYGDPSAFT